MNPANISLKNLSEKIRQYLSGEDVPDKPFYLTGMKGRLQLGPDGDLKVIPAPDYEATYKKARDEALELKQGYSDLPKLPPYQSKPIIGLQDLLEWCIDASNGKAGQESWPEEGQVKMTLLEEFEENVEVVVEGLEKLIEIIEHQFIVEDVDTKEIKGITLKTCLVKGLKENAASDVSLNLYFASCLWKNRFSEIFMYLTKYLPQFKSKIEKQYFDIIKQVNAIPSRCRTFENSQCRSKRTEEAQSDGLSGLETGIRRLADDLRYCAKMAREDLASKEPAETGRKDERSKIMITAGTSKENWEAIRSEYGISKKDFGKKINFVSDSFKRKIIFRDIEHAFVLASQGFPKPAIILAGGVIEELLRLYLENKNIQPKCDKFFAYIEACENNKLLKRGVSRLTDSIRDFRNLVHLANEETKKHTISKATAKGAVSSIFTVANDF